MAAPSVGRGLNRTRPYQTTTHKVKEAKRLEYRAMTSQGYVNHVEMALSPITTPNH